MDERSRAVGMLETGKTQRDVAERFRVSQSVISRLWNRYLQAGNCQRKPKSGRPRCTTGREDRYLVNVAKRNRFQSAVKLTTEFRRVTGRQISSQTIRNRLHEGNLKARRPAVRPVLKWEHRRNCLQWATEHQNWDQRQWRSVLFSDESRFCVDFHDGRRLVWRAKGERYADCCISEHDRFGGGSVMIWAGISVDYKTDLHIIEGSLTGAKYRDNILHPIVRPIAGTVGEDFILMDDNARPYRARIVNQYLEDEAIERMDWPSRSPDLNPIEHAWDILQQRISARQVLPQNRQELQTALQEEWQQIPQASLARLMGSMGRRCQAVIDSRGGHTKY